MSRIRASLVLCALGTGMAVAGVRASEFSADLFQTGPKGESSEGRLFVSDDKVRTEMQRSGKAIVQIADGTKNVAWILFPAEKTYVVQEGRVPGLTGDSRGASGNPCDALPGAQCRELGPEKVAGRDAVKWEVSMTHQDQTVAAQQWIDSEYKIPLRQQLPNNHSIETRLTGRETVNGREVEKVEVSLLQEGKVLRQSAQWFDLKLRLVVRQEFPSGGVSEVRNIKEGPQDPSLFQLPVGYKEMTLSEKPPSAGAPAR